MPKVFWKNFTQTFCYASSIFGCWVFIKFYQRNALFSYYGNIRFLFFPKSYGQMFKSLFHCCWPSVDLYWWFMSFCAKFPSLVQLQQNYSTGWFFAIFPKVMDDTSNVQQPTVFYHEPQPKHVSDNVEHLRADSISQKSDKISNQYKLLYTSN